MNDNSTDDWDDFEEKIEQAMCEVMLNDNWRDAPMLTMVLKSMLELRAPEPIKKQGARLVELLATPLGNMTDGQRGDVSNELVDLMRFACHRGRKDDDA